MKRLLLNIPLYLLFALCGAMVVGKLMGFTAHPILSGSMEPAIRTGSLAIVKPVPVNELKEGDVIAFKEAGKTVGIAHRIVKMEKTDSKLSITTKGDNNNAEDPHPYVVKDPTLGKVFASFPGLGYALEFLHTKAGLMLLAGLGALSVVLALWPTKEKTSEKEPRGLTTVGASS